MNKENKMTTESSIESEQTLIETKNTEQSLLETKVSEQMVLEHPSYKQLLEKLSQEEQKSQELYNKWLLAQADFENLKRRTEREITQAHKYAIEKFAYEVLITVDNLERSLLAKVSDNAELKDFYTGIELTLKFLLETLQKFGITTIDPLGEEFNPEKHTAVTTKEDPSIKSHMVIEVIQKGYWFKERLLRPALVVVAK
ncbi:MAG: nucleotide exchange factor GrpE [Coxiellaceae bacterium]|jgi:molecular chaperone GrpE|nr:nucleotide exchange factor GrpE [Coxiellaceae bacterium]